MEARVETGMEDNMETSADAMGKISVETRMEASM